MHGVPVAVKDQFWTKGVRSTGVPAFSLTSSLMRRHCNHQFEKAGAIVLGKTNMTEFAITGFSHRYSTPRNPWNLDTYTGGSSSGSGAATAGYLCASSLGEDTGGSIRFPCDLVRTSRHTPHLGALVTRYGVMRGVWSMDTFGAHFSHGRRCSHHTERHRRSRAKDPYSSRDPIPDYRESLGKDLKG
ncbi:MAG: hypothetical protein Ct9H300mP11_30100 [Chloroflexota bacterium]|nr:MAG: hypothetical protein Ct9H300mP11_30100 [Chloroflexota bacterium]